MKRSVEVLKYDFKFKKFELDTVGQEVFAPEYDDSAWKTVRVPHDWAIGGEFREDNDPQHNSILEDGIKKPIVHIARTGGLPIIGAGVYRRWVEIDAADIGSRLFLELDGVMWQSKVYCNGIEVGGYHFGYGSYEVEITDAVCYGKKNLIAVYAEVRPAPGRWYTGGGLYRNLRLVKKDPAHIRSNGVWIRQVYADRNQAVLDLSVELENAAGFTAEILAPDGTVAKTLSTSSDALILELEKPVLWDVDDPQLYTAVITLESGDSVAIRFGIRISKFTTEGYFLNGRHLKMNGVCMHHDLGSLGAAVNTAAMRRQLEILQGMGVNALRTSHNPPAPELLDLCDEMGILVMDEFFDEWQIGKVKNGYSRHFPDHACDDLRAVIRRDRNHPSVVMWSLGNEVREQEQDPENGWKLARMLYDAAHAADPTRPVTNGLNKYPACFENYIAFFTDVVGLNYKPLRYRELHEKYPEMILVGSETASCTSTRSVYHFPAEVNIGMPRNEDLAISAYELAAPGWAYYPERELAAQEDCPYVAGEFIWTGFDYLGEPTPYYVEWPSRSAYFGVVDMAGLPKNRYYGYRSAWTDRPTLHLFPHWTWPGREGKEVPIHIYTNYEEVELFVNGASQGKRRHDPNDEIRRFRLIWEDVVYQPGEITAVAYQGGVEMERKTVKTAGAPHRIQLTAYKPALAADGDDVNYITAAILDEQGTLCEPANHRLTFAVSGTAELLTTDAGDQRETEPFSRPDKKALGGLLVACVRSIKDAPGTITVTCSGEGLESGTLTLLSK